MSPLWVVVACGQAPAEPPTPEPEGQQKIDAELAQNLARCGNRTPKAEFTEQALPWFHEHRDAAVPALIELVERGGGSSERAALALGALQAQQAVPALNDALNGDLITHQAAAARALWQIGAHDVLRDAIARGGDAASRALEALQGPEACDLVAVGLQSSDEAVLHYARQAAERCGCALP